MTDQGKRHLANIDFDTLPPILGYNKTLPLKEGEILARWKETHDPMLAVRRYGKGRVLAYTSDPAPHWGCNFIYWDQYNDFWLACLECVKGD